MKRILRIIGIGRKQSLTGLAAWLILLIPLTGLTYSALSFNFQYIDDPTGGFASRGWLNSSSLFQTNILAALNEWGERIDSNETIVVDVVSDFGIARAGGTFTFGRFLGTAPGGEAIWEPGPLTRILTGNNPGESSFGFDVKLSFNPTFVENTYWFDPQPELRIDPVQSNKGDLISVVMHEFGHGLGMAGNRSFSAGNYGQINGSFMSLYDSLTYFGGNGNPLAPGGSPNPMFFSGPVAAAAHGSDVPVTFVAQGAFLASQNFYHLSTCQGTDGLDGSLMNGCAIPNGERIPLTDVDLAIFEDQGYPMAAVPIIPGDFNGDGLINGADLALWEIGYGTTSGAVAMDGDADFDEDVDGADFLIWQEGSTASPFVAAASVPEPSTIAHVAIGIACVQFCCHVSPRTGFRGPNG